MNNLVEIRESITQISKNFKFLDFKNKSIVNETLKTLDSIDQNEIRLNTEKERMHHNKGIEIYRFASIIFGNNIEYVFNVNAITDFIQKNNIETNSINVKELASFISDVDQARIYKEIDSGMHSLETGIAQYKKRNPIILIGEKNQEGVRGLVVNGNHRILSNHRKYVTVKQIEYYFIDHRNTRKFLVNEEYKKLHDVMSRYYYLLSQT